NAAGRTVALASPVAGAGMICPDTAYAALSPAAGRYKIDTAFGAYAGFKLLYPAGPLIVAAGLGMTGATGAAPATLLLCGVLLTLPVWAAGVVWGRLATKGMNGQPELDPTASNGRLLLAFAPFVVMASLLVVGGFVGPTGHGVIDFLLLPKGALIAAASLALFQTAPNERRACLDSAVRRTGSLLLVIGAASAFGAVLTGLVALDRLLPSGDGLLTLIALFALTVLFKLAQGSSMATFAAVAPVAAPVVLASGVNEIAAVFAICLGSFIAILPNDSYYWLVRRDALADVQSEGRVIAILTGGAVVQALVGMALLLAAVVLWP
ncbi:MAG: permease, partial [Pseudomonadota bacterium]